MPKQRNRVKKNKASPPGIKKVLTLMKPNSEGTFNVTVELYKANQFVPVKNPARVRQIIHNYVINFLDAVAFNLFVDRFDNLNVPQRAVVWNCVKQCRDYDVHFLNHLLIVMDSSFMSTVGSETVLMNFEAEKLRWIAQNIMGRDVYMCMTILERQIMREYLVKTGGHIIQLNDKTSNELKRIMDSVTQAGVPKFPISQECDERLVRIIKAEQERRYKTILNEEARANYGIEFQDLVSTVKNVVKKAVEDEYKVQILKTEGRDPLILDEAAYLLYLIPFKCCTLYGQYVARKFRRVMINKQWGHLKLSQEKIDLSDINERCMAYLGLACNTLGFIFKFGANRFLLTELEFNSITHFPQDFPRRFHRLLNLNTSSNSEEHYLKSLFCDDPTGITRQLNLAEPPLPEPLPLYLVQAFSENTDVFSKAGNLNVQSAAPVQPLMEAAGPVKFVPASCRTNLLNDESASLTDAYLNLLEAPVKMDESEKAPEVVLLSDSKDEEIVPAKETLTIVHTRNVKLINVNSHLAELRKFTNSCGSFYWAKFTVFETSHFDKERLLFGILDYLPLNISKFLIFNYYTDEKDSIFYARQCNDVLECFIKRNLVLKLAGVKKDFIVEIQVGCDNPFLKKGYFLNSALMNVLGSQLQEHPGHIDLSAFHRNKELAPTIFYPLRCLTNFQNILGCVNSVATSPIFALDISNNSLSSFSSKKAEVVKNLANLKSLKSLDLRNNQLNFSALSEINLLPLKRVYLDGNPLCSFYENEQDYITDTMKIWPHLEALDGRRLIHSNIPSIKQHYLVISTAQSFVDQFLTHYFSIYDSNKRELLAGIYHSKSMLSMTCTFLGEQSTSDMSNLSYYFSRSRNVKRMSDFSKMGQFLYEGNKQIVDFLTHLPPTRHDPASFNVDVIQCSEHGVHIAISGLFREKYEEASPRFFRRVMFLVKFHDAYLIVNELMYINNCTTEQALVPESKPTEELPIYDLYLSSIPKLTVYTDEEKLTQMKKLSDMTGMTVLWSKKCLHDMSWDLRNALIYFQSLYEKDAIPGDAFL